MTSFDFISQTLQRRVKRISKFIEEGAPRSTYERTLHQSSAVCHLWQVWVAHNRDILCSCLRGSLHVNGRTLASPISNLSESERLYYAQQLADGSNPKTIRAIKSHLSEPNWGDVSKVLNICSRIAFDGSSHIMNCFGLANRISDLQLCRNTCSHLTRDQIVDFSRSRVRYRNNSFLHPSDMLRWIDPDTDQALWDSWCGEMLTINELIASC